jgi:hypothetical protein
LSEAEELPLRLLPVALCVPVPVLEVAAPLSLPLLPAMMLLEFTMPVGLAVLDELLKPCADDDTRGTPPCGIHYSNSVQKHANKRYIRLPKDWQ